MVAILQERNDAPGVCLGERVVHYASESRKRFVVAFNISLTGTNRFCRLSGVNDNSVEFFAVFVQIKERNKNLGCDVI